MLLAVSLLGAWRSEESRSCQRRWGPRPGLSGARPLRPQCGQGRAAWGTVPCAGRLHGATRTGVRGLRWSTEEAGVTPGVCLSRWRCTVPREQGGAAGQAVRGAGTVCCVLVLPRPGCSRMSGGGAGVCGHGEGHGGVYVAEDGPPKREEEQEVNPREDRGLCRRRVMWPMQWGPAAGVQSWPGRGPVWTQPRGRTGLG